MKKFGITVHVTQWSRDYSLKELTRSGIHEQIVDKPPFPLQEWSTGFAIATDRLSDGYLIGELNSLMKRLSLSLTDPLKHYKFEWSFSEIEV